MHSTHCTHPAVGPLPAPNHSPPALFSPGSPSSASVLCQRAGRRLLFGVLSAAPTTPHYANHTATLCPNRHAAFGLQTVQGVTRGAGRTGRRLPHPLRFPQAQGVEGNPGPFTSIFSTLPTHPESLRVPWEGLTKDGTGCSPGLPREKGHAI